VGSWADSANGWPFWVPKCTPGWTGGWVRGELGNDPHRYAIARPRGTTLAPSRSPAPPATRDCAAPLRQHDRLGIVAAGRGLKLRDRL
jgi:hypothetical protein